MTRLNQIVAAGLIGSAAAFAASADVITVDFQQPALDRWVYPFASNPGREVVAPTFGAILQPGFDDRDGQFLVGFDTASQVTPGLDPSAYLVVSARVKVVVSSDQQFRYDPSFDPVSTLFAEDDPSWTPDADTGKPVELFGVGYRNGWTVDTFLETSPFGGVPIVPPAEGARNVFPAMFDGAGVASDISRQVREGFDWQPMAIGRIDGLATGELVPAATEMEFVVDLCQPTVREYFQRALQGGKLRLMISSLSPAQGGPSGGTGDPTYPAFFTKENPTALINGWTAKLELVVMTGQLADRTGDGIVDFTDYLDFLNAYDSADPSADYNGDCIVDFADYLEFLNWYNS
ncbi:MAG: hypothetical protein IT436_10230 [Phycisphaerales bacterium]|nr:hypothetical protein [Phycisphaerales bacterium]